MWPWPLTLKSYYADKGFFIIWFHDLDLWTGDLTMIMDHYPMKDFPHTNFGVGYNDFKQSDLEKEICGAMGISH